MRGQSQTEDKKRNVLESSVWQQTQGAGSHQTDGTEQREERLTRYLGQRNIDWRRSSDLWGNDVIILSSCPLECSIICVI